MTVNITSATYSIIEQVALQNLGPLLGYNPLIAGFLILLIYGLMLVVWQIPMEISVILGIGLILIVASSSNALFGLLAILAASLSLYIFLNGLFKLISKFS